MDFYGTYLSQAIEGLDLKRHRICRCICFFPTLRKARACGSGFYCNRS